MGITVFINIVSKMYTLKKPIDEIKVFAILLLLAGVRFFKMEGLFSIFVK